MLSRFNRSNQNKGSVSEDTSMEELVGGFLLVDVDERGKKSNAELDFVNQVVQEINEGTRGNTSVSQNRRGNIEVTTPGNSPESLAEKYSVFSTFKGMSPDSAKKPELREDRDFVIELDPKKVSQVSTEYADLQNLKKFLGGQGYEVETGNKKAYEACSQVPGFPSEKRTDKEAFKDRFGIDFQTGKAIAAQGDAKVVTPFAAHVATRDDDLMIDLEQYYKEAGLKSVDGNNKQFIMETRAPGKLHESNISISQASKIKGQLERRDLASKVTGKEGIDLRESEIEAAEDKRRGESLSAIAKVIKDVDYRSAARPRAITSGSQSGDDFALVDPKTLDSVRTKNDDESSVASTLSSGSSMASSWVSRGYGSSSYSRRDEAKKYGPTNHANFERQLQNDDDLLNGVAFGPTAYKMIKYLDESKPSEERSLSTRSSSSYYGSRKTPIIDILVDRASRDMGQGGTLSDRTSSGGRHLVSNDLDDLKAFHSDNTPYKLVKDTEKRIESKLKDPKTTQEQIAQQLTALGVEDLEQYKLKGTNQFNTYQIGFDIAPLLVSSFVQKGVLIEPEKYQSQTVGQTKNQFVTFPEQEFGPGYRAKSAENVVNSIEWRLNEQHDCGWTRGGRRQQRQEYNYTPPSSSWGQREFERSYSFGG